MNTLPYDDILQAVAECQADLDKSESINNAMYQRMFAPVDKLQGIRDSRAKAEAAYEGSHRRASEQNKGAIGVTLPEFDYASHD